MGSDNDIAMPVGDLELGFAQGEPFAARMTAGSQIEFPAVPGADDVLVLGVMLEHASLAVLVHRFADQVVNPSLAHRSAAMGTLIVPGDQFAIDVEDPDFDSVRG